MIKTMIKTMIGVVIGEDWYRRLFASERTVHWFMNSETRRTVIDSARSLGEAFMLLEEAKEGLDPGAITRAQEEYYLVRAEMLSGLALAYASDPFRADLFCRPSLMTRLEKYLFLDGIPKSERKAILRDFRERTDIFL